MLDPRGRAGDLCGVLSLVRRQARRASPQLNRISWPGRHVFRPLGELERDSATAADAAGRQGKCAEVRHDWRIVPAIGLKINTCCTLVQPPNALGFLGRQVSMSVGGPKPSHYTPIPGAVAAWQPSRMRP